MHKKEARAGRQGGRVVVGLSGGVDSAVAAYLLQRDGFEVIGVTLRTWESGSSRCCEIDLARKTAFELGMRYCPWNAVESFREHVEQPFLEDYVQGRTPNPCVECNPCVKWAGLVRAADALEADYVATGHYASVHRLENGRFAVKQAADRGKDQSYMLCRLTQEQLARTIFPLGDMTKREVREIAASAGLSVQSRAESQEICFVTEGGYAEYLEKEMGAFESGNFVDEAGHVLGEHGGIARYTVGQRKGLGLALGHPVYVKAIRPETNEVVVAEESALYASEILCDRISLMGAPEIGEGGLRALVRIRYRHSGEYAKIVQEGDGRIRMFFDAPVRAPAPGQTAAFYDGRGYVLGGGRILATSSR